VISVEQAADRLKQIGGSCAKDDWDGYGASAVTPRSIKEAKRLIGCYPDHIAWIGPSPRGGVIVQWSLGHDVSVEINPTARDYGFSFVAHQCFEGDHVSADTIAALIERALVPWTGPIRAIPVDVPKPSAELIEDQIAAVIERSDR
jgi:hypothetical protein